MASNHENFDLVFGNSDSDSEEYFDFEGFTAAEINDSSVQTSIVEEDDEGDDISVESLTSDDEDIMEKSSSDESDHDVVLPAAGGNVKQRVFRPPAKVVIWTERKSNVNFPHYNENSGPSKTLNADKKEIDFFALLFNLDLCVWIAAETNRYAEHLQQQKGKRDKRWEPTTGEEIRVYLGIRIYMSVIDLPDIKMYWSEDLFFGGFPIANVMTRDRFEKLQQYFHVADRTGYDRTDPHRDKCHLVRPMLIFISEACLENYIPHKEQSVDEAMIAFRGQLGFRQYIPAKPTKYGIKVWVRADSNNGYVYEFEVYVGKPHGVARKVGLGKKVVLKLTEKLRGKHNHVYFDNYFNSVELQENLLENGLFGCGTVKSILKFLPPQMSNKKRKRGDLPVPKLKLKPGESKQWQYDSDNGPVVATIWQEKAKRQPVRMLSSNCNPAAPLSTVSRKQKDGTSKDISCPVPVVQYNKFMNGVDRSDQLRTMFSTARRSRKWWTYLFWFLVDLSISNALILINESPNHQQQTRTGRPKPRSMLDFRKALSVQLIGDYRKGKKNNRTGEADIHGSGHWPIHTDKKRKCKNCQREKRQKIRESIYACKGCSVFHPPEKRKMVHLCLDPCFERFHTQEMNSESEQDSE